MSAGDIAGRFSHTWPTTSRHLRVLEQAGLLTHERQGRTRIYRVNQSKLDAVRGWLRWFDAPKPSENTTMPKTDNIRHNGQILRDIAMTYPGAHEDFPWGETAIKVAGKAFLFMHMGAEQLSLSCKLPASHEMALMLPFAKPTGYGLGKSGWVSAAFGPNDEPPIDLLREWLDESYRAVAPKKLSRELGGATTGSAGTERPAGKKTTGGKATAVKKTAAKKAMKKTVAEKATAGKKTATEKATPAKKPVAERATAAKKTATKKVTAAKKTAPEKATAENTTTAAKKVTGVKETAAKKTTPAEKSTAAKKATVAKKTPAKKTASKAAARKTAR